MKTLTKANFGQPQWILLSIGYLSTAVFLFEITLTRLFSIAHFYHFAFIVVTLALLGNGSSGTFLTIFPIMNKERMKWQVALMSVGCSVSILGGYLFFNRVPFDSYAVAIDPLQLCILSSPPFSRLSSNPVQKHGTSNHQPAIYFLCYFGCQ